MHICTRGLISWFLIFFSLERYTCRWGMSISPIFLCSSCYLERVVYNQTKIICSSSMDPQPGIFPFVIYVVLRHLTYFLVFPQDLLSTKRSSFLLVAKHKTLRIILHFFLFCFLPHPSPKPHFFFQYLRPLINGEAFALSTSFCFVFLLLIAFCHNSLVPIWIFFPSKSVVIKETPLESLSIPLSLLGVRVYRLFSVYLPQLICVCPSY